MNKHRNFIHLIGVLYGFNDIIKERLLIEVITEENFISKFLIVFLKLFYSLFRNEFSKKRS